MRVTGVAKIGGASGPPHFLGCERIAEIDAIVAERDEARNRRDWKASDQLRDRLAALGVTVKDGKLQELSSIP